MMKCCIAVQEEKIAALQSFAEQLIGADHYAKPEIFNRRKEVLDRLNTKHKTEQKNRFPLLHTCTLTYVQHLERHSQCSFKYHQSRCQSEQG